MKTSPYKGFTLPEILVVVAILSILSTLVFVTLRPAEYLKKSRDERRVADLNSLSILIGRKMFEFKRGNTFGSTSTVYVSLEDTVSSCANLGLPTLQNGYVYHCASSSTLKNTDGTGWLPIDLSQERAFGALPIDPRSGTTSYYAYIVDSQKTYILTAPLESARSIEEIGGRDGGEDSSRYETGNNLHLWGSASGL